MKKRTLNPVFNESFVFDLPASQYTGLEGVELEFLVLDWDRLTKNEVIGRLELGRLDGQEKATKQWQDIQVTIAQKKNVGSFCFFRLSQGDRLQSGIILSNEEGKKL